MSRRPSHPVRLLASALAAGALLTTAACSDDGGGSGSASDTAAEEARAASPAVERDAVREAPTGSPTGSATASALTESGAKAALITEADVEDDWNQVQGADKWHDNLLVGKVDVSDFLSGKADAAKCQQLLDRLYSGDLLGTPSGASALTGFEQGDSRLLEQVAAYNRTQLNTSLKWLATLPQDCAQFTATGDSGDKRTVQVTEASVPEVGDTRQGVHVTVQGTADGNPATLTLDIAAVRVGINAVAVTGGGLSGAETDSVQQATRQGTERLQTVLAGKTPSPQPGNLD
ncbi:hypothetical protein [Streptomyces sp. SID5910]|uniref:hypothetical protein n=1 Tax=Streptomyces sp. SID5910 TaxID=2690312 RepID=UPI00136D736A|nr:hypothetical protein [Streptomyces sp. SID5910]MYR41312.1 hypothetical protein [Streptomyces sp. SID5910]